jgi:hypothetical protein
MANSQFETLKARLKDQDKIDWLEERAAIREFEAGFDRDEAERLAAKDWFLAGIDFFKKKDKVAV